MHTSDQQIIDEIMEYYRHSSGVVYMPAEKLEETFCQVRSTLSVNEAMSGFTALDVLRIALKALERQVISQSKMGEKNVTR